MGTGVNVSVVRPGAVRTEFFDLAAGQPSGLGIPDQRFAVSAEAVGRRVAALVRRLRRVAYVPNWLRLTPWVEPAFGWLLDRGTCAAPAARSVAKTSNQAVSLWRVRKHDQAHSPDDARFTTVRQRAGFPQGSHGAGPARLDVRFRFGFKLGPSRSWP